MTDKVAHLLVRVGVAFAFAYPAIHALFHPDSWVGYFPLFVRDLAHSVGMSDLVLLHTFGAVEVCIALWLLSGKHIFWPSLAATAMLLGIVVLNPVQFEILFRDLALAAASAALAAAAWRTRRT